MRAGRLGPLAWVAGLGLTAAALGLASGSLPRLREALQRQDVDGRQLGSRSALRLLRRLGALHPAPELDPCGELHYSPRARSPASLPSTLAVPAAWRAQGVPILSIAIEPCRLDRLLENPQGRGRAFEEFASVSFFEAGELRFASGAGLRLHGGWSRRLPRKSFRLHLRDRYGETRFPPALVGLPADAPADPAPVGPGRGPFERLVVHSDLRIDRDRRPWQFINSLAYDIARRVGAVAPYTRPVWLFLNGEPQQVYVLTERIGRDFLRRRFGHDAFTVLRGRNPEEPALRRVYAGERRWARETDPLTPAAVEARVDLESLTRWYVSVLFCATEDAFQSPLVRSERAAPGEDRRWRFLNWDMDLSFRVPKGPLEHGWQKDLFRFVARGGGPRDHIARILLKRLAAESPAYRARLAARLAAALNHRLTAPWLAARLAHYEALAVELRLPFREFLDELRSFLRERPAELRRQMRLHLDLGPERAVRVRAPGAEWLAVEGHPVGASWRGVYFDGMSVAVSLREGARGGFSHWRVNGRDLPGSEPALELPVSGELDVEAVARAGPATRLTPATPGPGGRS